MKITGLGKRYGVAAIAAISLPVMLGGAALAPATAAVAASCGTSVANLGAVTYADRLVRAWGRGDQGAVGCFGTSATARGLAAQAMPGGIHWRRVSTEGTAGTIYVTYHDDARGGNLTIGVQDVGLRGAGGWHAATSARFRGEPPAWNAVEWSDNLVRAWGRGDSKWMAYYATPAAVKALKSISAAGGPSWQRIGAEGAAGTTYVTYRNAATGRHLAIGISNIGLSQGDAHVAYRVQYS